jgi:hypothetical protein
MSGESHSHNQDTLRAPSDNHMAAAHMMPFVLSRHLWLWNNNITKQERFSRSMKVFHANAC